eukprot:12438322-Ditylum_brightwellii.AAC.1
MSFGTNTEKVRIRNSIIIPPWIVKAIDREEAGSFVEAFMTVLGAARSKDIIELVDSGDKSNSSQDKEGGNVMWTP